MRKWWSNMFKGMRELATFHYTEIQAGTAKSAPFFGAYCWLSDLRPSYSQFPLFNIWSKTKIQQLPLPLTNYGLNPGFMLLKKSRCHIWAAEMAVLGVFEPTGWKPCGIGAVIRRTEEAYFILFFFKTVWIQPYIHKCFVSTQDTTRYFTINSVLFRSLEFAQDTPQNKTLWRFPTALHWTEHRCTTLDSVLWLILYSRLPISSCP